MSTLSQSEMLLRLAMAFVAGCLVGWERETRGRPAGLRTNILACLAAALAMILSEVLFSNAADTVNSSWRPDPARLGAGILTGIGFLGAGTILRHENMIRGVTTAASLWFVTVLGLAFGAGQFPLGLIALVLALLTLYVLPRFEKHIQSDAYATLLVAVGMEGISDHDLRNRITGLGPKVHTMKLSYDLEKKQKTFICELKLRRSSSVDLANSVTAELARCPGVLRVKWF